MYPHRILKWIVVTLAFAVVTTIYFLYEPQQHNFFLVCPLHYFTGFKCPLCGLQQMIHHVLHGQFLTAFTDNPFLFILLPYIIIFIYLNISAKKDKHPKFYTLLYGDKTLLILLIIALIFGIFRNLI